MSEISLREYIESQISALEGRLRVQHDADQRALKIQTQEYERRLSALNHEHDRVDKIVENKVDRKEWDVLKDQIMMERGRLVGETESKAKSAALLYSFLSFLAAVVTSVGAYLFHKT